MAGTRSSARLNSSPQSEKSSCGTKRKAEDTDPPSSGKAKRGRPSKEQKTLEETMPPADDETEHVEVEDAEVKNAGVGAKGDDVQVKDADVEMKNAEEEIKPNANDEGHEEVTREQSQRTTKGAEKTNREDVEAVAESNGDSTHEPEPEPEKENGFDRVKAGDKEECKTSKTEDTKTDETNDNVSADAVEEDKKRDEAQPSNILEKGIIYFFTRGRVGITEPESVQELQRSFFVMRPLPDGAKITDGAIQDVGNNRLLALPKKVWPKNGKDRFMMFVEKAGVSMDTLKEEFFEGSEYSTKTTGTRQTPNVTPLGEGVYALVSTQGSPSTTHLAYMLTIPGGLGEVQKDVGLAAKGSFVVSAKNPESSGPSYAQLPQKPNWPKEYIEEFGGRGWMPAVPKYLDYANAQMLLIGEDFDSSANLEPAPKDEKDGSKETPEEELEKLEHEDELRVQRIYGDDTIFADLGISSKEYPQVKTTW